MIRMFVLFCFVDIKADVKFLIRLRYLPTFLPSRSSKWIQRYLPPVYANLDKLDWKIRMCNKWVKASRVVGIQIIHQSLTHYHGYLSEISEMTTIYVSPYQMIIIQEIKPIVILLPFTIYLGKWRKSKSSNLSNAIYLSTYTWAVWGCAVSK